MHCCHEASNNINEKEEKRRREKPFPHMGSRALYMYIPIVVVTFRFLGYQTHCLEADQCKNHAESPTVINGALHIGLSSTALAQALRGTSNPV
jgi:hypothetical protein